MMAETRIITKMKAAEIVFMGELPIKAKRLFVEGRSGEMKQKQVSEVAAIITTTLGYTNGWVVSEERYCELCRDAAKKVISYLETERVKGED